MAKAKAATIGAQVYERNPFDLYPTTACLLHVLPLVPQVANARTFWEPAAGDGRLGRHLMSALPGDPEVYMSDINPTSPDEMVDLGDFLEESAETLLGPTRDRYDCIVTNPPFTHWDQFARKGIELVEAGVASSLVLLARSETDFASTRSDLFARAAVRLVCPWRPRWVDDSTGQGRWPYCWWAWTRDSIAGKRVGPTSLFAPVPPASIRNANKGKSPRVKQNGIPVPHPDA